MKEDSGFGMKFVIGAMVVSIMLFMTALLAGYILDDIISLSANEHSLRAPKTY